MRKRRFSEEQIIHVPKEREVDCNMPEAPEQSGASLLFTATPEELGAAAVRGAQRRKEEGLLKSLLEKADAGSRTDGVTSLEDMDEAEGQRGKPEKQKGPEGPNIKAGIRTHLQKKHGRGKP